MAGKDKGGEQPPMDAVVVAETPQAPGGTEMAAMIQIAQRYPRDEAMIRKDAMAELETLDADEAAYLWYSIPYKTRCPGEKECTFDHKIDPPIDGKHTVYVEGPSIGAALDLARRWKHTSHGSRIIVEDDESVMVEGAFMDWQNNVRTNSILTVSKFLRLRSGGVVRLSEDRLAKAIAAAGSKARRNAILAGMPRGLVQRYWQRAKQITQQPSGAKTGASVAKPIEERRAAMVQLFGRYGIGKDRLEKHRGKPLAQFTDEDLTTLRGVAGAIRDGFVEADEAFAISEQQEEKPAQTVGDVIKGKAE